MKFLYNWFFDWSKQDNLDIFLRMYIFIFLFIHFIAFLFFLRYAYKTYDPVEKRYTKLKYMWLELINTRNRSVYFWFLFRVNLKRLFWFNIQRFNENWVVMEEERWLPDETWISLCPDWDWLILSFSGTFFDFFRTAYEYISIYWEE